MNYKNTTDRKKYLSRYHLLILMIGIGFTMLSCSSTAEEASEAAAKNEPIATIGPIATSMPIANVSTPTITNLTPIGNSASGVKLSNYTYKIVNTYPHDLTAFTQGLVYENGIFYEGTGLNGQSTLRKVAVKSGQVQEMIHLEERFFGEGITILGNRIYQLTWQSGVGFVYDKESLALLQEFTYSTEGWGITHDGSRLIMSDGTSTIYFWDPETLAPIGEIQVYDAQGPVVRLNELEYIQGEIYANIWQTDRIARISPETGQVLGWIDLSGLLSEADKHPKVNVLNGIAYDETQDRLFVTGKLWPKLFEIELIAE